MMQLSDIRHPAGQQTVQPRLADPGPRRSPCRMRQTTFFAAPVQQIATLAGRNRYASFLSWGGEREHGLTVPRAGGLEAAPSGVFVAELAFDYTWLRI